MKPIFKHDCDQCTYISTIHYLPETSPETERVDIYICRKENRANNYIARMSDEGSNYLSWCELTLMMSRTGVASAVRRELFAKNIIEFNLNLKDQHDEEPKF